MSNTVMITGNVDHTHFPNLPRSVLGRCAGWQLCVDGKVAQERSMKRDGESLLVMETGYGRNSKIC